MWQKSNAVRQKNPDCFYFTINSFAYSFISNGKICILTTAYKHLCQSSVTHGEEHMEITLAFSQIRVK